MNIDIIFHVGAPKSGSSAIQVFCLDNTKALEQQGLYYPDHGLDENGVSGGHSQISGRLINKDIGKAQSTLLSYYKSAKKRGLTLLLSAEGFYQHAEELFSILPNIEKLKVLVIGYFRHPVEALISNHNQGIKRHFSTEHLSEAAQRVINTQGNNKYLNGDIIYEWRKTFGKENVKFKPFDRSCFVDGKIELDFLEEIGIGSKERKNFVLRQKPTNNSYSPSATNFKRAINAVLDRKKSDKNGKIDIILQAYSDKIDEQTLSGEKVLGTHLYNTLCDTFSPYIDNLRTEVFATEKNEYWGPSARDISTKVVWPDSGIRYSLEYVFKETIAQDEELSDYLRECLQLKSECLPDELMPIGRSLGLEASIGNSQQAITKLINRSCYYTEAVRESADYLRELSSLYESLGYDNVALDLITKALNLRPKGPVIKEAKNRLTKKIQSKNH